MPSPKSSKSTILPSLSELPISSRSAFAILRLSTNAGLTFLVRASDTLSLDASLWFDKAIDDAIRAIARQKPNPTIDRRNLTASLRSLPLHLGGLGIQRHSWLFGQVGMLKARTKLWDFVEDHLPHLQEASKFRITPIRLGEHDPLNHVSSDNCPLVLSDDEVDWDAIREVVTAQNESICAETLTLTLARFGPARAAWLRSSQFDGSGRFLLTLSDHCTPPHLKMTAQEYHQALRMRLLLGPHEDTPAHSQPPGLCPCKKYSLTDPREPFHLLDCHANDAFFTFRHSAAVSVVHSFLKKHLCPQTEFTLEPALHDRPRSDHSRRSQRH